VVYRYSSTLSLNSVLHEWGGERLRAAVPPEDRPSPHCTGGWVVPTVDPDKCKNSCPTAARIQTVHPVKVTISTMLSQPTQLYV
jgi:hypothetical protein